MNSTLEMADPVLDQVAGGLRQFDEPDGMCRRAAAGMCAYLLSSKLEGEYTFEEVVKVVEASLILQDVLLRDDAPDLVVNGCLNDLFRREAAKYLKK